MNPKWTIAEGIDECKKLESFLIPHGFHCALGGSVLHRGQSFSDLDIFIYPHKTYGAKSSVEVIRMLRDFYNTELKQAVHDGNSASFADDQRDGKEVWYCREDGQRIDFFLVN
jgi:hypothetical protein